MSGYKFLVAIHLPTRQKLSALRWSDPPTQYVAIINTNVAVFICSLALWETIARDNSAVMREANPRPRSPGER